jgi:hypothetical protein
MDRGSRKRSSSARREKMERVGDRQEKMEGYCSTGHNPQRAVVPMERERERERECVCVCVHSTQTNTVKLIFCSLNTFLYQTVCT